MSSDGGSWAPFGPGSGDDEPESPPPAPLPPESEPPPQGEPPPESEPPPVSEPPPAPPEPEPPPAAAFRPPVAQPLPTLPDPSSPPRAWPSPQQPATPPAVPTEPSGPQAPWPPQGYRTPAKVPQNATVALVLGVVSVLFCGLVGPFAIHYGLKARAQIAADPSLGGRGLAGWGLALGVVSTTLLVLALILIGAGVIVVS